MLLRITAVEMSLVAAMRVLFMEDERGTRAKLFMPLR